MTVFWHSHRENSKNKFCMFLEWVFHGTLALCSPVKNRNRQEMEGQSKWAVMWKSNVTSFDPRMLWLLGTGHRDTVYALFFHLFLQIFPLFTPIWHNQFPRCCSQLTANYCFPVEGCVKTGGPFAHIFIFFFIFAKNKTKHASSALHLGIMHERFALCPSGGPPPTVHVPANQQDLAVKSYYIQRRFRKRQ